KSLVIGAALVSFPRPYSLNRNTKVLRDISPALVGVLPRQLYALAKRLWLVLKHLVSLSPVTANPSYPPAIIRKYFLLRNSKYPLRTGVDYANSVCYGRGKVNHVFLRIPKGWLWVVSRKRPLSEIRKERKLTQEDIAKHVNLTRQAVSAWEKGKALPDVVTGIAIAEFLNVSVYEIDWTPKSLEVHPKHADKRNTESNAVA